MNASNATKNPTVDRYVERFNALDGASSPEWLQTVRRSAMDTFAESGFPGPRDEAWRFTNISALTKLPFNLAPRAELNGMAAAAEAAVPLATVPGTRLVFVDGYLVESLSRRGALPDGAFAGDLRAASETLPLENYFTRRGAHEKHAFAALNTAFGQDGAVVYLKRNCQVAEPIHVVFLSSAKSNSPDAASVSHPRLLVVAEEGSEATVVESYAAMDGENTDATTAGYLTTAVGEFFVAENARLEHVRLQNDAPTAYHVSQHEVYQAARSDFRTHTFTVGGRLVRNDLAIYLDGEGIESTLNGLYITRGEQHVDNHTRIDHAKPHCNSHELYKGILDDRSSAVFNGRIFVAQDAQKTDAKQSSKNLLLSRDATVNANPELEIFADDVRCTHGATIGSLDDDQLFYLRARGIDRATAQSMLTFGFASEVVSLVGNADVGAALHRHIFPDLPAAHTVRRAVS